jgi:soluble lytic murein transglycosylase-like protein
MGLMQLMPATARRFGVADPDDPAQHVAGGTRYLRWLLDRYGGDVALALAGYNAGEGAVDRHGGIPPYRETQNYVRTVRSTHQWLRRRVADQLARAAR